MNKLKRVVAFLLTFIMCLQVMTFSAFAEDTSKQGLEIDRLLASLILLKQSNINLNDVYAKNEENQTLYIAESDNFYIEISANKGTNILNSLKISLNISEMDDFETEKVAEAISGFSVSLGVLMVAIDPNADYDTIFEALDITNISSNKEYIHNNIKYTKTMKSNVVKIEITPIQQQPQQPEPQPTPPTPQPQNNTISVVIDGQALVTNVAPQSINGRTMVPMRSIFEALGATVTWNADTKQAVATKGDKRVTLTLNSDTAYINGEAKTLEAPAISYNGSTLVPARFVAEAFGANVTWDNATKTVNIVSEVKPVETTPAPAQPEEPEPEPEQTTVSKQVVDEKPKQTAPQGNTVYVTKTGKKYHYNSSCNGGTYYASTLEQAKARGLTPCSKCVN